jgi:tRNA(Ile)-lysidine synthase
MLPDAALVERFSRDLDRLSPADARIGVAVSGGADSLALLLLAAAARPDRVEAATVNHGLREGSSDEAAAVAAISRQLGVTHEILTVEWPKKPESAIQQRAREERYRLLGGWAKARSLDAVLTAHHLDDQAETLMMRLARGAGVRGLAGMRAAATVPGSDIRLLRPLLGWRRSELADVCGAGGLSAVDDPSNQDDRFERVRVRRAVREADWLDPQAVAASASHLGDADAAVEWAARQEWASAVRDGGAEIAYRPSDAPAEIRRRIVQQAVGRLATEGSGTELRGRELDQLLAILASGGQSTLRGVQCAGGPEWLFTRAPPRRT